MALVAVAAALANNATADFKDKTNQYDYSDVVNAPYKPISPKDQAAWEEAAREAVKVGKGLRDMSYRGEEVGAGNAGETKKTKKAGDRGL